MAVEATKNIKIDPRVDSYKTFFDHAWARKLDELVAGSKLAEPVFSLCINWKAAANTHLMPWLKVGNLKGLWGSQRTVYGAVYHTYENFVSRCVGLARNEPDYRSPNAKALHADARAAFGDTTADFCLTDQAVDAARLVRNALAHHGGKETD